MLARMPRFAFLSLLPLLAASVPALADDVIDKVLIKGLDKGDDAAMIENIEVSLSLYAAIGLPLAWFLGTMFYVFFAYSSNRAER